MRKFVDGAYRSISDAPLEGFQVHWMLDDLGIILGVALGVKDANTNK